MLNPTRNVSSIDAPNITLPHELIPETVNDPVVAQIASFRILKELGRGGMGCVWMAEDSKLNRLVALKTILPKYASIAAVKERFLREARAMAALSHDHIVAIHEVGEHEGLPYLVMPLLEGESLQSRLAREPRLPTNDVLRIGREMASGLAFAHSKGLIHRDIKPGNLWLEPSGRVKILDFGLARSVDTSDGFSTPGAIMGSPGYISPEQLGGVKVDARTDLFSLGCVLYLIATGKPVFPGSTASELLQAVESTKPDMDALRQSPPALARLLGQLLSKNPADRPQSATLVAKQLAQIEQSKARRPLLVGLAVAIVGIVALVFLIQMMLPNTSKQAEIAKPVEDALKVKLDVSVWKKRENHARGQNIGDLAILPLVEGDGVRIEVTASRPAYLYLMQLDAEGQVSPIYPWRKGDWKNRPEQEKARQKLWLPDEQARGATVTAGPSGIESLLLLARETALTQEENQRLAEVMSKAMQPGKAPALEGVVWMGGDEEKFSVERDRGRLSFEAGVQLNDPVQKMRGLLRDEAQTLNAAWRGVCYPFQGK
jgi:hypothetical protein